MMDGTSSSRRAIPCLLSLDATCINGRISETKEVLLNASLVSETGTGVMLEKYHTIKEERMMDTVSLVLTFVVVTSNDRYIFTYLCFEKFIILC